MIIYILKKIFNSIIGDLPLEQRAVFWARFTTLLEDIVKAGAEGAVEGIKK